MKFLEKIKAFIAKVSEYITAVKDIKKQIFETINGKEEEQEVEEEEEETPKKPAKKKNKKK